MQTKSLFCMLVLLCTCMSLKAQLSENFNDGNFSEAPSWTGDTSSWKVNAALQLQSIDTVKNGSFYLSTINTLSITTWQLYVNLAFNTSSANYVDIYLTASTSDLSNKTTSGYFVRLGGTNDDICLYRKDTTGTIIKLIDGVDKSLNKTNNIIKLKIIRDSSYQWTLYRDLTGTGNSYFNEGSFTDSVYIQSSFFGIFVKQSTASFFGKHFFDDIQIGPVDTTTTDTTTQAIDSINNMDIVINEILFNPKPGGVDYVELYNRSSKAINLKQLYIANRNSQNAISSITPLSIADNILLPENFIVVTQDPDIVKAQYFTPDPNAFITVSAMPSFNDGNGAVIILTAQQKIIDELQYDESWQFSLLNDPEGVSLERINYNAPTQTATNWHSAATSAGYGTPGYINSQYTATDSLPGMITTSPAVFSPDNDGIDDFATINYRLPQPGYIANISIFDAAGRLIRHLVQNGLCGSSGMYRWDGLGAKGQQLPIGIYIVYTQLFDLEGRTAQFKNVIVLARKIK